MVLGAKLLPRCSKKRYTLFFFENYSAVARNTTSNLYLCTKIKDMDTLEKYSWLIGKLRIFSTGLTLDQIKSEWKKDGLGDSFDRSKLLKWRNEIENRLGLRIVCRKLGCGKYRSEYRYIIENDDKNNKSVGAWIINSVSVCNTLNLYKNLNNRIICDTTPHGTEHLHTILEAMSASVALIITYKGLGNSEWTFRAEPYAVRQHQGEWYVLCKIKNLKTYMLYALGRITALSIQSNDKFKLPCKFNAQKYFGLYFGSVVNGSDTPCRIVLRAYGSQINKLRSHPLHESQAETTYKDAAFVDFSYYMMPTCDLSNAIVGLGPMVEVISPVHYRDKIICHIKAIADRYDSDSAQAFFNTEELLDGNFAVLELDVANEEPSSICEIAVVIVKNGEIIKKIHSFVRPTPFYHSAENIKLSGITESVTRTAPLFPQVWKNVEKAIAGLPLVGYYTHFAEKCLEATFMTYDMPWPKYKFLDALKSARSLLGKELLRLQDTAGAIGSSASLEKRDILSLAEDIAAIALNVL